MAIYGVSFYGSDLYGEAVVSLLSVEPFTAESRSYETASLSWAALGGNWSEFRLLRSGYGFAVNEYDGDIILQFTSPTFQSSLTDTGLAPNRFYYYTIFVFDLDTDQWVRAGQAQVLTLKDYGYYDLMIRHLPSFYTEMDDLRRPPGAAEGQLRRFLRIFALALDHIRGETESLGRIRSADDVSGGLLPFFSEDLGITYEPEIGMRQMRIWLRNAIYLYKIKGTRLGIEGVATAMTGWGADVRISEPGHNFIPNSDFEQDADLVWSETGAAPIALSRGSGGRDSASALNAQFTSASTSPVDIDYIGPTISVTAGRTYAFSAWATTNVAPDAGSPRLRFIVQWLDEADASLGSSIISATHTLDPGYERIAATGTAPAGAVKVAVHFEIPSNSRAAGDIIYIDDILFEENSVVREHFAGHTAFGVDDITIDFQANRVNLLTNPSFEVDISDWTGVNATLSQDTADAHSGDASALVTTSAGGEAGLQAAVPVTEDRVYSGSIWMRDLGPSPAPGAQPFQARVEIDWLDGSSTLISTSVGEAIDVDTTAFVRSTITAVAPEGAEVAVLRLIREDIASAGQTFRADAALFEESSEIQDYFDGSLLGGDYIWQETAHASPSHFYFNRAIKNARLDEVLEDYAPLGTTWAFTYAQP